MKKDYTIAVAGTGYVGLSIATLLSQHHKISAQSLSISYRKQLHKVIEEFNPDIVIFHYPNPFVASFLLKELKNRDIKLVVYWHLDIIRQKFLRVLFNGQNRKLLERADKVIATSPNYIEGSKWLQSVKSVMLLRPLTCHIPVSPGLVARRAR